MNLRQTIIYALSIYLILIALLYAFQRRILFVPGGKITDVVFYNLEGFSDEDLVTSDGARILAWYRPAKKGEKIILFFHGNGGNLANRAPKLEEFSKHNFGVLAISYRGYPGSKGAKPTEVGLLKDGEAAFKFLLDRGYMPSDIILYGESIGSGVATQLSARFDFFAVILESPFASITSVAQKRYWFAPVNLMLKDRFDSENIAPKIASPVLFFHHSDDPIVPISDGKKLFDKVVSPKKFVEVEGRGHTNFDSEFLLTEIEKFLDEVKNKTVENLSKKESSN